MPQIVRLLADRFSNNTTGPCEWTIIQTNGDYRQLTYASSAVTTTAVAVDWETNYVIPSSAVYRTIVYSDSITVGSFPYPPPERSQDTSHPRNFFNDRLRNKFRVIGIRRKAKELLRSILTPSQWTEYCTYGSVRIVGSAGGIYEIGGGWNGMVYKLDIHGNAIAKLCIHPQGNYPIEDSVVALVLNLLHNEPEVLRKANTHQFNEHEQRRVALRRVHRKAV